VTNRCLADNPGHDIHPADRTTHFQLMPALNQRSSYLIQGSPAMAEKHMKEVQMRPRMKYTTALNHCGNE
jgi:hypothetical protein